MDTIHRGSGDHVGGRFDDRSEDKVDANASNLVGSGGVSSWSSNNDSSTSANVGIGDGVNPSPGSSRSGVNLGNEQRSEERNIMNGLEVAMWMGIGAVSALVLFISGMVYQAKAGKIIVKLIEDASGTDEPSVTKV